MAKIYVSSIINAPIEKVWPKVRDFNSLPDWHPFIEKSRIEDGHASDKLGCIRNFDLKDDGGNIREQLLTLSDEDHQCTYSILESPMPVSNDVATINLHPVTTRDVTFATWTADFDVPEDEKEATVALVTDVFQSGFGSLNESL